MKNIFMYLFIFSLLFNIFQYVNSNKILDAKEKEVVLAKSAMASTEKKMDSIQNSNYFDISKDEDAQEYYYKRNLDYLKVMEKVNEDLLELNTKSNGNPLIPYEPIDGKKFLVNRTKVLNHRWIVAEFSNGELWGQILVKYFYNDDKPTDFETVETVLYEKQRVEK